MMESNRPYGRVTQEDGLVNGAFIGAGLGAAATGGAHMFGNNIAKRVGISGVNKMRKGNAASRAAESTPLTDKFTQADRRNQIADSEKIRTKGEKRLDRGRSMMENHGKVFGGGWKGKAAAYGGSAITGGLIGAGIDHLNN